MNKKVLAQGGIQVVDAMVENDSKKIDDPRNF